MLENKVEEIYEMLFVLAYGNQWHGSSLGGQTMCTYEKKNLTLICKKLYCRPLVVMTSIFMVSGYHFVH